MRLLPSEAAAIPSTLNRSELILICPATVYCFRMSARRCFHVRKREAGASSSCVAAPSNTEPTEEKAAPGALPLAPSGSFAPSGSTSAAAIINDSGSIGASGSGAAPVGFGSAFSLGCSGCSATGTAAASTTSDAYVRGRGFHSCSASGIPRCTRGSQLLSSCDTELTRVARRRHARGARALTPKELNAVELPARGIYDLASSSTTASARNTTHTSTTSTLTPRVSRMRMRCHVSTHAGTAFGPGMVACRTARQCRP